ncbi:MAG: response regulator [Ignavibacteriales bacterium]|nr:response regulator [Ignavibacteriales bacterium]
MKPSLPHPNQKGKILIAEDSPTQAEQLKHLLLAHGYVVVTAGNGKEALRAVHEEKPTLIISDIMMPEMDGYELCRSVKSDPQLKDIPVMLLTSLSDPADIIRGLLCAADNFIVKPYSNEELLNRIEYILVNRELRRHEKSQLGVDIFFAGQRHLITSDRLQILDLLFSTYETAVQKNQALVKVQDELKRLNKELEAFGYSISHDLRTPVRHILGFTELLLRDPQLQPEGKARGYVSIIQDSCRRMMTMIDGLLAFSRLSYAEMRREHVDMDRLVREARRDLGTETGGREVIWNISPLPSVDGDRSLLYEVLQNLLGNAVKYTRPRMQATIEVGSHDGPENETTFFVRDNGVGFDMKYAHRLFEVFQRLHAESEFSGTGVGLANVRRIIARHGGKTWAESKEGEGATFFFSLPKPPPENA